MTIRYRSVTSFQTWYEFHEELHCFPETFAWNKILSTSGRQGGRRFGDPKEPGKHVYEVFIYRVAIDLITFCWASAGCAGLVLVLDID